MFESDGHDLVYDNYLKFFEHKKELDDNMAVYLSKVKNIWFNLNDRKEDITKLAGNHDLPEVVIICKILNTLPEESSRSNPIGC